MSPLWRVHPYRLAGGIRFVEYDLDTPLEAAIGIGYGGIESYGFHALETLQCMIERRTGGESGVVAVQCLEGDAVWQAGADGHLVSRIGDRRVRANP